MFNPSTHSLILRACNADMTSKNRFVWPSEGFVECPDWYDNKQCGNGLHGWLYGHGDGSVSNYWDDDSKWLVVLVETSTIVDLDGKVKFKNGVVLFCGTQKDAIDFLMKQEPRSLLQPIIGAFITVGHKETATSGYKGTSTSGNYGTSNSGNCGTSNSGNCGTSNSGNYGTSSSGYTGTATSGEYGTSSSGYKGTSTSGIGGKCKAGEYGIINIYYLKDGKKRLKTGYIGEDGLEPDVFYELDYNLNFKKCD